MKPSVNLNKLADFFFVFLTKSISLQQYRLLDDNVDSHRWFYFPHMKKDEVLLHMIVILSWFDLILISQYPIVSF